MNIKVLVDFSVVKAVKNNDEHIDMLKRLSSIYDTSLFILQEDIDLFKSLEINSNITIYVEEELEDKDKLINDFSKEVDWILYFKENIDCVEYHNNIVYSPIYLKGNLSVFKDISFAEHARNKKYYHDFSDYYMYTLANDTEKETLFLINLFKKYLNKDTGKVLDCCCGVGRHSYLMAKNGFKVTGIDFSDDQIENAKKMHGHSNIDYKVMDARNFNLEDKDYDMSYCMWTTYNYLSQDRDFKSFIEANYLHQKKDSILVLDSKNIPRLEPHRLYNRFTEKDKFKMEMLINKYVYNNIQNSQYFLFINDDGIKKFFYDDEFVRFYTIEEIEKIVSGYYEIVKIYGDFDMNEYDEKSSNRFIVVLRRI